jgi:Uma2 family endonuclease
MQLVIEESFLPVTLTAPPMNDEQFAEFCAQYADYTIEMTACGEILIMPPNYSLTGARNGEIGAQLKNWASREQRGVMTDASGGFVLPNGARRAPDAAWTLKSRVLAMDRASLNGFWRLCPDFVIELRSQTDRLPVLRAKMQEWIDNGAQLGWLIDPERGAVEIYRPGHEPEVRSGLDRVAGEQPVEGFELDLRPVWEPLSF